MKRTYLWSVTAAVILALAMILTGCGAQNGSSDGSAGKTDVSDSESVSVSVSEDGLKDDSEGQLKVLKWRNHDLKLEELRDLNDSDNFAVDDPPSGSRYVVTKFVSTSEEIPADEITEENTESFCLKDSGGGEYAPCFLGMWGVGFDDENGFSTKEMQEGFNLLFLVPENIELNELSLELK